MTKLILTGVFGILLLSACKKDYTCTCTNTFSYDGISSTNIQTIKIEEASKKQASYACSEAKVTETYDGSTFVKECKLSK